MPADGENWEGLMLKFYLVRGKAEGNTLMRPEPAEEERGRRPGSSFSNTMVLVVQEGVGTMGPGRQLWPLAVHPGRILVVLGRGAILLHSLAENLGQMMQ